MPDVVYAEHLTRALYLDKREDVDHYAKIMNHLGTRGPNPAETKRFLAEIIRRPRS